MSISKTHIYDLRLCFKTLEANCQRSSCKVHIFVKIESEQRKLKEVAEMKKNVAVFNSDLLWESVPLRYDEISGTYFDELIVVSIHYETSENGVKTNKLKVGQVTINVGKMLNTRTYRINSQYGLEKCYDPNAKLKLSIDLTRTELTNAEHQSGGENYRQVSSWKVSKIRDKMNEDEKALLQTKLQEYEQRIEKHRDDHAEQLKRLADQIERKEQKIVALGSENNSLSQALQVSQLQLQKAKARLSSLETESLTLQQEVRSYRIRNEELDRELGVSRHQLEEASVRLGQVQEGKDRKEQHYKQELQKYLQKYMESERSRNRIVLQMENKLKDELLKKDDYYRDLISKLESKLENSIVSSKQSVTRKDKELTNAAEKYAALQKQLITVRSALAELESHNSYLQDTVDAVNIETSRLQDRVKCLDSEAEVSSYSNANLQREVQKLKSEIKICTKNLEESRSEVEMANRTIEEQDAMLAKLHRSVKIFQEREYYMEEKYEEELEIKTYNQSRMIGSNNYYKTALAKLQVKLKFMEERIEDSQCLLQGNQKEKERLQEEMKGCQRQLFENTQQTLRLQSELKRSTERQEQLEQECNQRKIIIGELQQKLEAAVFQYEQQVSGYLQTINELDKKCQEMAQQMVIAETQWQHQFQTENSQKNQQLEELDREIAKLRKIERELGTALALKQQQLVQIQTLLQPQKDRNRILERQLAKKTIELEKAGKELEQSYKQLSSIRGKLSQVKSQAQQQKSEQARLSKKMLAQKDAYTDLIKWILDRNYEGSRQFVQVAGPQIELELISFINTHLDKQYSAWDRNSKALQQLREQNDKVLQHLERNNLEAQYEAEFNSKQRKMEGGWETQAFPNGVSPFTDVSNQLELTRIEQLKTLNQQLHKDLSTKIYEIQSLNEDLFEERAKAKEQAEQTRRLHQEIEDLTEALSKKTSLAISLQAQIAEGGLDVPSFPTWPNNRSPVKNLDFRIEAESKFKQQRIIAELEKKLQDLDRQNNLQKSKIELLESRLKSLTEKSAADLQKINTLQKSVKEKEEAARKFSRNMQQKQKCLSKLEKQVQLISSKLSKKQALIEEIKSEAEQHRKIAEILAREVEEWESKFTEKQRKMERESYQSKKYLIEAAEKLTQEKMEKDKLQLQQSSQITYLASSLKQAERRILSLESLLQKSKSQNEELYEKHLQLLSQKNQAEELAKDLKMLQAMTKQNYEKTISELQEKLQPQ